MRLTVLAACVPKAKRIAFYGKTRVKVLLKKSVHLARNSEELMERISAEATKLSVLLAPR